MPNERDIDDAIDRAVREIMSIEPRAGLRGRVLGRLERPTRAQWLSMPRLAVAAALLLAIAIGLFTLRPAPAPDEKPLVAVNQPSPASPPQSASSTQVPGPSAEPGSQTATARTSPVVPDRGTVGAASVEESTTFPRSDRSVPAPGSADAGSAPPIKILPIALEPIVVAPIVVQPITRPR